VIIMANGTARPFVARSAFAYLGRNQGPELFFTDPFTAAAPAQSVIPKTLSLNRPLESIAINVRFRVVIGVADYDAVAAEAPATFLQRLRVTGTFKGAALTPIDMTGATINAWMRLFGLVGSSVVINGVRQPDPGDPYAQTVANFGAQGSYDVDLWYVVPTWPVVTVGQRAGNIVPFCYQPRDWNDTLQIQLDYGDRTSFGTPNAATTTVFTAFGSAAGTPQARIFTSYLILGAERSGFRTACVVRNEQSITQGVTALGNNVRLGVLQKQKTTNVLVKSGTVLAGTSAGVNVYAALSNLILDSTQVMIDNRPIRNNQFNLAAREHVNKQNNTILPQGYLPFLFADSQTPRSAYRGDLPEVVAPGAQFELVTNVVTAGATNQINVVQEQIWADRDDPAWMGTR